MGLWSRVLAARLSCVLTLLALASTASAPAAADGGEDHRIYQDPSDFLHETFPSETAERKALWISGDLKGQVEQVMGHQLGLLRVRYWVDGARTAWILEEIGKVELITVGIVVDAGRIENLKILIYRESRGWEVRYPFFTNQFVRAGLEGQRDELDQGVEGISGATLSVDAVTRLARLALVLDRKVEKVETAATVEQVEKAQKIEAPRQAEPSESIDGSEQTRSSSAAGASEQIDRVVVDGAGHGRDES